MDSGTGTIPSSLKVKRQVAAAEPVAQNPVRDLGHSFGDVVGRPALGAHLKQIVPALLTGQQQHCPGSHLLSRQHVACSITDDIQGRSIEIVLATGLIDQSRLRFPATTAVIRMMRTDIEARQDHPLFRQQVAEMNVDGIELLSRDEAPRHTRLVGHHDQLGAGRSQARERFSDPGQQFKRLYIIQITRVPVHRAVAVEKYGHAGQRSSAGCWVLSAEDRGLGTED